MSSREMLENFYGTGIAWFEDPRDERARKRFELVRQKHAKKQRAIE